MEDEHEEVFNESGMNPQLENHIDILNAIKHVLCAADYKYMEFLLLGKTGEDDDAS